MADVSNGGRIVPIVTPTPTVEVQEQETPPSESPQPQEEEQELKKLGKRQQPRRKTRKNSIFEDAEVLEIPCLNELGLYALPTEGDGNCLYYALSDQLYGDFTHGEEIRLRLADHISSNPEYFINFTAAVGEVRRAPRRAATMSKYSSHTRSSPPSAPNPSDQDKEKSFNDKVTESRKNGVWGGAEEIQACCQSFKKDIQVYTMYGVQTFRDVHAPEWEEREILHIAFHDFHHYSSVRHTEGPHTGMPSITKERLKPRDPNTLSAGTVVEMATPWKISAIQEGLGGKYDRDTIIEMLQQCRGNIDRAFCNLLDDDSGTSTPSTNETNAITSAPNKAILKTRLQPSSRSSSPFSSGSKRSAEDGDESDPDSEDPRPAQRRRRPFQARERKRRILPDVTVGIAFRDDQNDLVSLRLRVSPDAVAKEAPPSQTSESDGSTSSNSSFNENIPKPEGGPIGVSTSQPPANEANSERKPRRSLRLTKRSSSDSANS
ncbi:OTU domain-containing protein [Aspergillus chevalieri]|uniref:OTU domain-containing protein n=1 Tax=Aspergillus chevalieri TaxID=182096 RepID=A0A7R7ZNI7_ASPCH|nr:uncharacterized protein ACHE_41127S [Aspergillus chevalieri]BCR88563.1 hypothetical protein ACHE_41127S [Aspergillus chevalieri]